MKFQLRESSFRTGLEGALDANVGGVRLAPGSDDSSGCQGELGRSGQAVSLLRGAWSEECVEGGFC